MAGANGDADHQLALATPEAGGALLAALLQDGRRFAFFQAVRLLHDLHPDRPQVGRQGPAGREPVRLAGWLSLSFPPGDVMGVEPLEPIPPDLEEGTPTPETPPYRLESPLLALYGTSSPLPTSYTEVLLDQEEGSTERGFYDLFQHRLLSLLWRVWARFRWEVGFRRDGSDFYSDRLTRFVGLGPEALPPGHRTPRLNLLALGGLLTFEPRGAAGMQIALQRAFPRCEVEVEPFAPRWVQLPREDLSRLGNARCVLGENAVLGERLLDRGGTFRVVVSCPDTATYISFLEDEGPLATLRELVDLFNPDLLDCELELRLAVTARHEARLGARDLRLGWSSWIGQPAPENRWIRRIFIGAFHG